MIHHVHLPTHIYVYKYVDRHVYMHSHIHTQANAHINLGCHDSSCAFIHAHTYIAHNMRTCAKYTNTHLHAHRLTYKPQSHIHTSKCTHKLRISQFIVCSYPCTYMYVHAHNIRTCVKCTNTHIHAHN